MKYVYKCKRNKCNFTFFTSMFSCDWLRYGIFVHCCNQIITMNQGNSFQYTCFFFLLTTEHTIPKVHTHEKWCEQISSHPTTPPFFKPENSQFTELRRNSKLSLGNVALVLFALARRWAWLLVAACLKPEEWAKGGQRENGKERLRQTSLSFVIWTSTH